MDNVPVPVDRMSKQRHLLHQTLNQNLSTLSKRRDYSRLTVSTSHFSGLQATGDTANNTIAPIDSPILHQDENDYVIQTPPSRPSRFGRDSRTKPSHPISKISNFFDKEQIRGAIEEFNNSNQKIKFIDFVIKRRKEIKNLEDQQRFDRATPLLKRFSENYRKRRTGFITDSSHASSFTTIMKRPSALLPEDTPTEPSDRNTGRDKNTESNPSSSLLMNKMRMFLLRSNNDAAPREAKDQISAFLENPLNLKKFSEVRKDRHKTRLMALRSKMPIKQNELHLGSQTLENDLYKFLLRNEDKLESSSFVLNTTGLKSPSIRTVEHKAMRKFEGYKEEKRHNINYLKGSRELTEARRERNKFILSSCKHKHTPKNTVSFAGVEDLLRKQQSSPKEKDSNNFLTYMPLSPQHHDREKTRTQTLVSPKNFAVRDNALKSFSNYIESLE